MGPIPQSHARKGTQGKGKNAHQPDSRTTGEAPADLSGRLINAQEEERARIARELHDNLSQKMALLAIEIEQLMQIPPRSAPEIQTHLRKLLSMVQEASAEMHSMSYELHPSKLDRLGLAAATRSFCREISSKQSLHVDCTCVGVPNSLPHEVSLCLYRVVQESLQNVIKHSSAGNASVALQGTSAEIRLQIADDGVGFRPESARNKHGMGLLSMQERLRLVGGTLSIESQPLQGTRINAVIPMHAIDSGTTMRNKYS